MEEKEKMQTMLLFSLSSALVCLLTMLEEAVSCIRRGVASPQRAEVSIRPNQSCQDGPKDIETTVVYETTCKSEEVEDNAMFCVNSLPFSLTKWYLHGSFYTYIEI